MVASNKLNFFRGSWIADYADPENYFALFYSKNLTPNGPNYFNFNDSKFDSLYNLSVSLNDLNERNKVFKKMNDIIEEKSVLVPLYYDEVYRFYSNDLSDFKTNSFNALLLKEAKKNIK
jgi:peptide/nickel transport system substrate-binding protein